MQTEKQNEEQNEEQRTTTLRALLAESAPEVVDFYRLDSFEHDNGAADVASFETVSYGALANASESDADCIGSDLLSGSDYSGGALVRSNVESMLALIEELEEEHECEVPHFQASGGYGTFALFFVLDKEAPEEALAAIVAALESLESYPVLDEEHYTETEMQDEEEAWNSYAESDFVSELAERIGSPYLCEVDFDGAKIDSDDLFRQVAERENLNGGTGVVHECEGPYFMTDEAAKALHPAKLFYIGIATIDGRQALNYASEASEEDANEARRVLRLVGLGECLQSIGGALQGLFFDGSLWSRKQRRGMKPEPIGAELSSEALDSLRACAARRAREIVLGAKIEAGDCDSPLALDSWKSEPIRAATVTLSSYVDGADRTVSFEVDPAKPYGAGYAHSLAVLLSNEVAEALFDENGKRR
jgi:hypothetical protein